MALAGGNPVAAIINYKEYTPYASDLYEGTPDKSHQAAKIILNPKSIKTDGPPMAPPSEAGREDADRRRSCLSPSAHGGGLVFSSLKEPHPDKVFWTGDAVLVR